MKIRITHALAVLVLLPLGVGCKPDDQEARTVDVEAVSAPDEYVSPETRAALDSGNAAYRRRDWDGALRHYESATEHQPDATAAWFGVYMAQRALGDTVAAARALERAGDLTPDVPITQPEVNDQP